MAIEVTNSPFTAEQAELLNRVVHGLTQGQLSWLQGYLAASGASTAVDGSAPATYGVTLPPARGASVQAAPPQTAPPQAANLHAAAVTVLYASQTGNCHFLSGEIARRLEAAGHAVTLTSMSATKPRKLRDASALLVLVSTQGDGVPPDNGVLFYEDLFSKKAPKLEGLRFSVLALGDISYDDFCKIGADIDWRLEELGGERLHPRVDCDLDFRRPAEGWMAGVLSALSGASEAAPAIGGQGAQPLPAPPPPAAYSRFNPFGAEVLENILLNGRGSDKETRHIELSLEGSGLAFEPGDSIGIYPKNDSGLVDELIAEMGWGRDQPVPGAEGGEKPLREALIGDYEITLLTKPLLAAAAAFSTDGLRELASGRHDSELKEYLPGRDLLDLVRDFGLAGAPAAELVSVLRRLPPRLYSVASSLEANPGEVHLVITAVRYEAAGRPRKGVFSTHCAEVLDIGDLLPVYVNNNPAFKLPEDPARPIIMVGPGTGVAPFRSFLEERAERGAAGKSWLFYGDRRFRTDFLYQVDWQEWLSEGVLTRMDVAFSRDGEKKDYVQHRMVERGRELFSWLEEGAYLFVCGDEKRMAPDVEAALIGIVEREGGFGGEKAHEYVDELRRQNRYQRDVY